MKPITSELSGAKQTAGRLAREESETDEGGAAVRGDWELALS